jgi:phasin
MATPRKTAPRPAAAAPSAPAPVEAKAGAKIAAKIAAKADAKADALDPAKTLETAMAQLEEVRELLRHTSETSLEQSRAAYARLKEAAEEVAASIESAYKVSGEGAEALRLKAVDALKANADAGFEYARAAAAAKTLPDLVTLQADFARKQGEIFGAQARDFASLAEKVATDAAAPIKGLFDRGVWGAWAKASAAA